MHLEPIQYLLGLISGGLVGFTLGLFGGGGSILAVPLMVYLVGVASPHIAIGTSALAVAANAATNLITHARQGNVRWRCAAIYSAAGIAGAFLGSTLGKALDGQKLLFLFALLMMLVGAMMLWKRNAPVESCRSLHHRECTQDHRLWCGDRRLFWFLRHRWWLSHRPGTYRSDGYANLGRRGIITRCGHCLWRHYGCKLRLFWIG